MGILQGFIFTGVILFSKKYSGKPYIYLASTVFCLSFSNLQYWFDDSNATETFPALGIIRIPCDFLTVPMFFLFVKSYLGIKVSRSIKIALCLPFLVDLVLRLILSFITYFQLSFISAFWIHIYIDAEETFNFIFSVFLIMQIIRSVLLYEKENTAFKAQVVTATTKWLKHILFIALGVCVFWGISIFLMFYKSAAPMYYPVWIGISFLIYWVSYVGANESYILSGRAAIREQMAAIRQNEINDASATATIASKAKIINQFEEAIRNLYLNPSLSQNDVAAHLGISSSYLSQVINNSNIKFNDYLNAVRIEKAKRMLSDETFSNYTITAIGLESGFNSNASFYRAFKKHTDLSPKDYRFSSR